MYGSRLRLGLVVPSSNTTVEMEFFGMLPDNVSVHITRVYQPETNDPREKEATILQMFERMDGAARELMSVRPGVIGYACTSGSFIRGADDDRATCRRLTQVAGVPFVTASTAVVQALQALNVRRVAVATPYIDTVNQREVAYLSEWGFDVVTIQGLDIVGNLPKGHLPAEASYELALRVDSPQADCVFISCTNWRTVENLRNLQRVLAKPVISSNQALMWAMLKAGGLAEPLGGTIHAPQSV